MRRLSNPYATICHEAAGQKRINNRVCAIALVDSLIQYEALTAT